jgi:hypothetical protein
MNDRKKIMGDLEGLTFDDWRMFYSDSEVQITAKNALQLLKEQEPENVLSMEHNRYFPGFYDLTGNCPGCHKYIEQLTNRHYCGYCGKGLIWDE